MQSDKVELFIDNEFAIKVKVMMHATAIDLHVENAVANTFIESVMHFSLLFVFLLLGIIQSATAGEVKLAWNAVEDARVHHYRIHTGAATGHYDRQQTTTATALTVGELESGKTYYFVASACDGTGSVQLCNINYIYQ